MVLDETGIAPRRRPALRRAPQDVHPSAKHDFARANGEGGDPAEASNLHSSPHPPRQRDGHTDEALRLYEEAACDDPFDPRPRALQALRIRRRGDQGLTIALQDEALSMAEKLQLRATHDGSRRFVFPLLRSEGAIS